MEKMTKCVQCGGTKLRDGVVAHEIKVGEVKYVVGDVPAEICEACGEDYVTYDDMVRADLTIAAELVRRGARGGDVFRFLRKALGMKAMDLAALLDVKPETLSRWETGAQTLDSNALAVLGSMVIERLNVQLPMVERLRALKEPVKPPRGAVKLRVA